MSAITADSALVAQIINSDSSSYLYLEIGKLISVKKFCKLLEIYSLLLYN